jgi:hypothetical protein
MEVTSVSFVRKGARSNPEARLMDDPEHDHPGADDSEDGHRALNLAPFYGARQERFFILHQFFLDNRRAGVF